MSRQASWGSQGAILCLQPVEDHQGRLRKPPPRLLSGRYRLEALSAHWMPGNKEGLCTLPGCWGTSASHKGTVENFLTSCPSLSNTRQSLVQFTQAFLIANNHLAEIVEQCLSSEPVQFWLDCKTISVVISEVQRQGEGILVGLFKLTRHYCHVLHSERSSLLE